MKVTIDHSRCEARGYCGRFAPDVFENDEDGYGRVKITGDVPAEFEAQARTAHDACPEQAILIEE